MRRLLQRWFGGFVIRMANKYGSSPNKKRIHDALSKLFSQIVSEPGKRGLSLVLSPTDKYIIFSDQHKGARDYADDFSFCEKNYLSALSYYQDQQYHLVCLGDSEELWENTLEAVKKHNQKTFELERSFLERGAFIKIFGNHDLYWDNDPLAGFQLEKIYGKPLKVYEGLILNVEIAAQSLQIFLTHGHQGDSQSDGNWFSKWFVSDVWGPLQGFLRINPNTPAYNSQLKTDHNRIMYEWSSKRKNMMLITGHTHQPVFRSLTQLEILYNSLDGAKKENDTVKIAELEQKITALHLKGTTQPDFNGYLDTYFNTGCCCFNDGDITGIEIEGGYIRLIKWAYHKKLSKRMVLEESKLEDLNILRRAG